LTDLNGIEKIKTVAMIRRNADDSEDPERKMNIKTASWEVPVMEIVYCTAGNTV